MAGICRIDPVAVACEIWRSQFVRLYVFSKKRPCNEMARWEEMMSRVRVLVGTRKGAFVLTSDGKREKWNVSGPHFGGWEIYHVKGSPADPNRLYASQCSGWFGQVIQRSDDGGKTWEHASVSTRTRTLLIVSSHCAISLHGRFFEKISTSNCEFSAKSHSTNSVRCQFYERPCSTILSHRKVLRCAQWGGAYNSLTGRRELRIPRPTGRANRRTSIMIRILPRSCPTPSTRKILPKHQPHVRAAQRPD